MIYRLEGVVEEMVEQMKKAGVKGIHKIDFGEKKIEKLIVEKDWLVERRGVETVLHPNERIICAKINEIIDHINKGE